MEHLGPLDWRWPPPRGSKQSGRDPGNPSTVSHMNRWSRSLVNGSLRRLAVVGRSTYHQFGRAIMRTLEEWSAYAREECETLDPVAGLSAVDWKRFGHVVEEIVATSQEHTTAEFVAALRAGDHIQATQRCENCAAFKPRQNANEPNACLDAASPIATIGPWRNWWCPRFVLQTT